MKTSTLRPFHEAANPNPNPFHFVGPARRCAEKFASRATRGLQQAVAIESVRRVFNAALPSLGSSPTQRLHSAQPLRPLHLQPGRGVAMRHIEEVAVRFHWEQHKTDVLGRHGWQRFGDDKRFREWVLACDDSAITTWRRHYLPVQFSGDASDVRDALASLHPMPEEIRERYDRQCQRQVINGVSTAYRPTIEHLVCLACQRLVAFHTLENAYDGPNGLDSLRRRCMRRLVLYGRLDPVEDARMHFEGELESPTVLNSLVPEGVLRRVSSEAWQVISRTAASVVDAAGLERELAALRPTRLWLERHCIHCHSPARQIPPEEAALPPFHRFCRCYQLRWDAPGISTFERRLRLWAIDAAVPPYPSVVQFPVAELLERCIRQPPRPKGGERRERKLQPVQQ